MLPAANPNPTPPSDSVESANDAWKATLTQLGSSLHPKLLLTRQFNVLAASPSFYRAYETTEDRLLGQNLLEVFDQQWNVPRLRDFLMRVSRDRSESETIDFDYDDLQGKRRAIRCEASLVSPTATEPTQAEWLLLSFEDHTPIRQLEDALRESEARAHTILMTAIDAIVMIDERGRIKFFNPTAERLFGYSQDEVVGENVRGLMPSPYSDEHDAYIRNYLSTGNKKVIGIGREVVGQRKDGTTFPMELSIVELEWGKRRFFLGTVRDITKQKRSEEALRNSETRVRAILNTAVDGIVTIDEKGIIKSCNASALKMFGYSSEEVIGENVTMLMPSPYADEHNQYLASYLATGRRRVIGIGREVIGKRRDGSTFPMELSVSEVILGDRRTFTGIVRNISDRKRDEMRMKANVADLEEARVRMEQQAIQLEFQAESLRQTQERAELANRAKSEFLANMSHEIRTPLTAVLGFADLLLTHLQEPTQLDAARIIRNNGKHLLDVINQILDLSKIESGKLETEIIKFSLTETLEDVRELFQDRVHAKQNELIIESRGEVPQTIKSDPTRLKQALVNLIGNAVKFTDHGTVRVIVECNVPEERITFHVLDTGIGIPENQIDRIFQPFDQADSTTTRQFGGTGLGLTITRRIAEMLGGDVAVRSEVGQGSRFSLSIATGSLDQVEFSQYLPCERHERETLDSAGKTELPALSGRVLLVEDGPDNQTLLRVLLERAGADVTITNNGKEGLIAALDARDSGEPFGIVLMDMQMPVMDGYQATRALRNAKYTGQIVALTAHAMSGDAERCLAAGCDAYLSKPIDRVELIQQIATRIDRPSEAFCQLAIQLEDARLR